MNEILVLKRTSNDADDGMFSCCCGVMRCSDYKEVETVFGEQRRADNFVKSYLRKTGKSVTDYGSTEEVINDFLNYCQMMELEGVKDNGNE